MFMLPRKLVLMVLMGLYLQPGSTGGMGATAVHVRHHGDSQPATAAQQSSHCSCQRVQRPAAPRRSPHEDVTSCVKKGHVADTSPAAVLLLLRSCPPPPPSAARHGALLVVDGGCWACQVVDLVHL
jgi:hypothetical protein